MGSVIDGVDGEEGVRYRVCIFMCTFYTRLSDCGAEWGLTPGVRTWRLYKVHLLDIEIC